MDALPLDSSRMTSEMQPGEGEQLNDDEAGPPDLYELAQARATQTTGSLEALVLQNPLQDPTRLKEQMIRSIREAIDEEIWSEQQNLTICTPIPMQPIQRIRPTLYPNPRYQHEYERDNDERLMREFHQWRLDRYEPDQGPDTADDYLMQQAAEANAENREVIEKKKDPIPHPDEEY